MQDELRDAGYKMRNWQPDTFHECLDYPATCIAKPSRHLLFQIPTPDF